MVFSFEIETPASTSILAPVVTPLSISQGVIRHWYILFPEGNWAECPLRIKKGGDPILPINIDRQMSGNGNTFKSEEFIYIESAPFQLQAYTWNTDIRNPHTLYISITIMPLWTLLPYSNQLMDLLTKEEVKIIF